VIVSEEADEEKKFAKQKLTIKPHRDRMNIGRSRGYRDLDTLLLDADLLEAVLGSSDPARDLTT
jgi:hypothetical protein